MWSSARAMRLSWTCRAPARTSSSLTGCSCTCPMPRWLSWLPTRCPGCATRQLIHAVYRRLLAEHLHVPVMALLLAHQVPLW